MADFVGNPRIRGLILEAVANQMRDNDPPETNQTYERLRQEGHNDAEAKRLLGCVVALEIFTVLKKKEVFNLQRFVQGLNRLPELPEDE
jgi:hypothetical protein